MLEDQIEAFLNRRSYSFASFEQDGITYLDQIVIIGAPGTGTSTLAKNLGLAFTDHEVVSGGNYQRLKTGATEASPDEKKILELNRLNAADPKKGTDRDTETFLHTKHLQCPKLIMEARNGHFICEGGACIILLICDEEICAERVLKHRLLPNNPNASIHDAYSFIRERRELEKRFDMMYPESNLIEHWSGAYQTLNSGFHNEAGLARQAKQLFNNWRERHLQGQEMIPG